MERPELWLEPEDLVIIQRMNANDTRCVSWVLWKILDPKALDIAIKLAGVIQWFEDELFVEPPYRIIVSTLEACFDSTGELYPESKDRAYYSGRAILWIHIRAMCVSEEFAKKFPLPNICCGVTPLGADLTDLLGTYKRSGVRNIITSLYLTFTSRLVTPAHLQWNSTALLNLAWANRSTPDVFGCIREHSPASNWNEIPSNAILNRLLTWCIFLGWPVGEVVLRVQDKSYAISCFCP